MKIFTHSLLVACAAFAALGLPFAALGQVAATPSAPASPAPPPLAFTGDALPVPPQQSAPWTPPAPSAALPEKLLAATSELFAQGLADPRGCEYREVEVVTGSVDVLVRFLVINEQSVASVHAWVLPAAPGTAQRFAVGLNGLVYPVLKVGPPVNLRADVLAIIAGDRAQMEQVRQARPDAPLFRMVGIRTEQESLMLNGRLGNSVFSGTGWLMQPIPACLLLRLGETELAMQWWQQWTVGLPPNTGNNDRILADPYGQLASDWARALLDRAVGAHMRGDDRLALLTARELTRVRPTLEAAAVAHGWVRRPDGAANRVMPLLDFLGPLPALLADQERRATRPKAGSAILPEDNPQPGGFFEDDLLAANPWLAGLRARLPNPAQRIAALIRDLDEVPRIEMGGLDVVPVVLALVAEGPAAVGPLLDCLENDPRLTRFVNVDPYKGYSFMAVSEVAREALDRILKTRQIGSKIQQANSMPPPSPEEARRQLAALYRAYWAKNQNLGEVERWFGTLADDAATERQWFEAARGIVQPVADKPVSGAAMRGESLRAKSNPSVTELLVRRITTLNRERNSSSDLYKTELAKILAQWEPAADLLALAMQLAPPQGRKIEAQSDDIWHLYALARSLGLSGWKEKYAAWARSWTPQNIGSIAWYFGPFMDEPNYPAFKATADWIFEDPQSPWRVLLDSHDFNAIFNVTQDLLRSPLLRLPLLQKQVLRGLDDATVIATISIKQHGSEISYGPVEPTRSDAALWSDPLDPAPGTEVAMRMKDYYADALCERIGGTPAFSPYWPRARRDEAIAALIQFIKRFGSHLIDGSEARAWSSEFDAHLFGIHLSFPKADHPATPAEAADGRAIFSLPDGARLVPLPRFPIHARWKTLKVEPVSTSLPIDKEDEHLLNEGLVWQAEEVLENGQLRRYYGFVNHRVVAKVPAEEIEILPPADPDP